MYRILGAILAFHVFSAEAFAEPRNMCDSQQALESNKELAADLAKMNLRHTPEGQGFDELSGRANYDYEFSVPPYNAGEKLYEDENVALFRKAFCFRGKDSRGNCPGMIALPKRAANEFLSRQWVWDNIRQPAYEVAQSEGYGDILFDVQVYATGIQMNPLTYELVSGLEGEVTLTAEQWSEEKFMCEFNGERTRYWVLSSESSEYLGGLSASIYFYVYPNGYSTTKNWNSMAKNFKKFVSRHGFRKSDKSVPVFDPSLMKGFGDTRDGFFPYYAKRQADELNSRDWMKMNTIELRFAAHRAVGSENMAVKYDSEMEDYGYSPYLLVFRTSRLLQLDVEEMRKHNEFVSERQKQIAASREDMLNLTPEEGWARLMNSLSSAGCSYSSLGPTVLDVQGFYSC